MSAAIRRFLTINPGSTSTKLATFTVAGDGLVPEHLGTVVHPVDELKRFADIPAQFEFRRDLVLAWLREKGLAVSDVDVFVGRGGFLRPIPSGAYRVNPVMIDHLRRQLTGRHPCNLGGLIAHGLATAAGTDQAYIVDPAIVDEMGDEARLSGLPEIPRVSKVHTLNHKAVGHRYAAQIGRKYTDLNLVIVHMGGGISIAAHQKGRMVDVNNGLDGEGAFTPERTGGLPVGDFMALCYSGRFTLEQMRRHTRGEGGMVAYLGTNDAGEVERRTLAGDEKAGLVYRAMAYQVAKDIGAYAAVLAFAVDAILLTGGLARSDLFCDWIAARVRKVAPVVRFPGGDEELALASGVWRGLRGENELREYRGE